MIISRTPFRFHSLAGQPTTRCGSRKMAAPFWRPPSTNIVISAAVTCLHFLSTSTASSIPKWRPSDKTADIQHPVVRAALELTGVDEGLEIHHDGDLPARTGLGSSSAFTVGMLNALYALKGTMVPKKRLAEEAIHLERDILKESVGSQDQVLTALGGFKKIDFNTDHSISEAPVIVSPTGRRNSKIIYYSFIPGYPALRPRSHKKRLRIFPKRKKS